MTRIPLRKFTTDTRGITWTIESFLSVALLLSILLVSMQMIPAGQSAAEQANSQQTQMKQSGTDVLVGSAATGELSDGMRYWNPEGDGQWHGSTTKYNEYGTLPDGEPTVHPLVPSFGALDDANILYNMKVLYQGSIDANEQDETFTDTVLYQGIPSSNAVLVEYTIILDNQDVLLNPDGTTMMGSDVNCQGIANDEEVTLERVDTSADCNYFIPDAFPDKVTNRYNTITVQLTLWK